MFKIASVFILSIMILTACNLSNAADITPLPTPDLPRVEVLAPQNNQQVYVGTDFDFDIVARDETSGIARVELYIDETLINTSSPVADETVPIFRTTMNWLASGIGNHIVEVISYRADGQQSDPARLTIEVLVREDE